jgi:hypothetical protein
METIKTLNPLLDLDPTVYAAGFSADKQLRDQFTDKGMSFEEAERERESFDYLNFALSNAKTAVEFVLNDCFPDRTWYRAFLTGKGNFRDKVATIKPYKGNRDPNHRPKYYKEIRQYLVDKYKAEVVEGMEADDMLGIVQWQHPDKSTVIVSIDKDLKMVPGYHFNPKKQEFFYQNINDANLFFLWQLMVGDTTDNIPGVDGIGPKKADKVIAAADGDVGLVKEAVQAMYQKQYGPEWQAALDEVSQLLWIRRREGEGPYV